MNSRKDTKSQSGKKRLGVLATLREN